MRFSLPSSSSRSGWGNIIHSTCVSARPINEMKEVCLKDSPQCACGYMFLLLAVYWYALSLEAGQLVQDPSHSQPVSIIHVIRPDIVWIYWYWVIKYEFQLTDWNTRYIWIPTFRFCQKLKLVFRSLQMLALFNLQQEATISLYWFSATGKCVYQLSSVVKNQHIFRHLIGCSDCINWKHEHMLERP